MSIPKPEPPKANLPAEEEPVRINKRTTTVVPKRPVIWDCGSTLYDSFELKSFERQLESALTRSNSSSSSSLKLQQQQQQQEEFDVLGPKPGRTQSMPHLSFFNTCGVVTLNNNNNIVNNNNSTPISTSNHDTASSVKKKKKNKSRSLLKQLLRSVFFRSKSSSNGTTTTSPKESDHSNDQVQKDENVIRSSSSGFGRWFQLVYEDDDHLIYEKDNKKPAIFNGSGEMSTTTLSTIPEVPELFSPQNPPHNTTDEMMDQPPRRRRWSSSSILVRKTLSDRFTGMSSRELIQCD